MSNKWTQFIDHARNHWSVNREISNGNLELAADAVLRQNLSEKVTGRPIVKRLTGALIDRANSSSIGGQLKTAWEDLTIAAKIALKSDLDRVSRQKNELVEITVATAESHLSKGNFDQAIKALESLKDRNILDWRADRIQQASQLMSTAEAYASKGDLKKSTASLTEAQTLRPDLMIIGQRKTEIDSRRPQMQQLTDQLQAALINQDWLEIQNAGNEILAISPNHEIALGAMARIAKRKNNEGRDEETAAWKNNATDSRATSTDSPVATIVGSVGNTAAKGADALDESVSITNQSASIFMSEARDNKFKVDQTFMLWVDGVGGYLVCPAQHNLIGQAIEQSHLQIPLQGDLQRRHALIQTIGDHHVISPLGDHGNVRGNVSVAGNEIEVPTPLRDGQLVELGKGVLLQYTAKHPLSSTARLDFRSRHRTQPWADGILLASKPIVLGPALRNHIHCRSWTNDLMIFVRNDEWFARTKGSFEIDGKMVDGEGPIHLNSRITGEDFSLSLEAL